MYWKPVLITLTRTPNPTHICSRLIAARWAVLSVLSSVKFTAQYR
jgi:hypothetical protein